MADNTTLPSGDAGGDTLASDDISGIKFPRSKIVIGADGTNDGDVSSGNPMPVTGTVTANLGATDNAVLDNIQTAVEVIDNAISGNEMQVDVVTSALPTGAATAAKQPALGTAGTASTDVISVQGIASMTAIVVDGSGVTQPVSGTVTANLSATDNAVLDAIAASVAGTVTVSGTVTANAGTNLNTSALALETGGNLAGAATSLAIIDDWDESDRAKANIIVGQAGVAAGTGIVGVTTQRVTIATDDTLLNTIEGETFAIQAAVEIMDDWDESDRCKSNIIVGQAGVAAGSGTVGATTQRVVLATDVALPAGTNAIGKLAANSGVDIGDVDVLSIAAGTNLIGDVGLGVRTSGGTTIFRSIDLDESEEEVKATAGQVYWLHCINLAASLRYLKFYNATAASVTVGTTTPVMTIPILTQGDTNGAGFTLAIPNGIAFSTAITVAATTAIADADTGAPGANEVIINLGYN